MTRVVVAFDSFKGSLSSEEANTAFASGIGDVMPDVDVRCVAISDGGEGFADVVGGEMVEAHVSDPRGRSVVARYALLEGGATAVVALASASGLTLVVDSERDPLRTTTYGTGELILDAMERGCRRVILGLGGSATCDGGVGVLRALGVRFYDAHDEEFSQTIDILERVEHIDTRDMSPLLRDVELRVAVDVDNPLCGERGAARVYAPQKGATAEEAERLDAALGHFAEVVARHVGADYAAESGMGAAGGVAFGLRALVGVVPESGIDLMLDVVGFDALLEGASLVVTGEGRIDRQTVMGKAPSGVLRAARRMGVRCIAVGGSVAWCDELINAGFDAIYAATPDDMPLEQAMQRDVASANLRAAGARYVAT